MERTKFLLVCVVIAAAVLGAGCAKKEMIKQEEPEKMVETPSPAPTVAATAEKTETIKHENMKYDVRKGDSLWKISSKNTVYSDPFEWPLLFKANRDQIQDPDIIEVNQELIVNREYSSSEMAKAVQDAKDTPPYKKHSKPRDKLPLKY